MHWWTVNIVMNFRERMFKDSTLVTLLILFLDVFLLSSFYVFSFISLFLCYWCISLMFLRCIRNWSYDCCTRTLVINKRTEMNYCY